MGHARCAHSSFTHPAWPLLSRNTTHGTLNKSNGIITPSPRSAANATGNHCSRSKGDPMRYVCSSWDGGIAGRDASTDTEDGDKDVAVAAEDDAVGCSSIPPSAETKATCRPRPRDEYAPERRADDDAVSRHDEDAVPLAPWPALGVKTRARHADADAVAHADDAILIAIETELVSKACAPRVCRWQIGSTLSFPTISRSARFSLAERIVCEKMNLKTLLLHP